jgi:hypothetical protein
MVRFAFRKDIHMLLGRGSGGYGSIAEPISAPFELSAVAPAVELRAGPTASGPAGWVSTTLWALRPGRTICSP